MIWQTAGRGPTCFYVASGGNRTIIGDNGMQPVRRIGRRNLSQVDLAATDVFDPILIKAGALGNHLPYCDMMVSPNRR